LIKLDDPSFQPWVATLDLAVYVHGLSPLLGLSKPVAIGLLNDSMVPGSVLPQLAGPLRFWKNGTGGPFHH